MRSPIKAATGAAALLVSAVVLAGGASAGAPPLVSTAHNAKLRATVLVNRSGRTLYHLSVEHKGHFICTDSGCLSLWHPLVVPAGTKPAGRVALGTVRRPDGRLQVTYKGGPLYAFAEDTKRGDVKGEGFRDVGVWHAATVGAAAAPVSSGGGGYGGGYGH
jgi:predicted lipoprotein with Yx(FWY)xxD motif